MFASVRSALSRLFGRGVAEANSILADAPALAHQPAANMSAGQVALPPLKTFAVEEAAPAPSCDDTTVLSRTEVLDGNLDVRGYQFELRGELRDKVRANSRSVRDFLDDMLLDQLAQVGSTVLRQRSAWLAQWEGGLPRRPIEKLPKQSCLLVLPEQADRAASSQTLERMAALRAAGHQIWLDDCPGTAWFDTVKEMASGMVVRLTWRTPRELADVLTQLRRDHPKMPLAAWEVGSVEDFNLAKQHGAAVFSGGFVTRRGDWSANQLSPHMLNVAMLVSQVREDVDIHEMARVLKQDVAMSYRLLRYVNTAGGRLSQPVASIEQGLVLMGQAQLDRWLTLLMLSGNTAGGTALMETALTRARFLELLGEGRLPVEQCELLFVLGLFSMLDVALRVPLETAIKPLQLPELLNRALLHREGRYGQYLLLAEACERGQLDHVFKHAMAAGLNTAKVNARHWAALEWVAGMSNDADEGAAKS